MGHQRFNLTQKIVLLYLLSVLTGCATVNVPNVGQNDYRLEEDEQRIINRSNEIIEAIDTAGYQYQDPILEEYLNTIALGLIPADLKTDPKIRIQIKILRDPTLNAFAFANGTIFVHTGILAAAHNEAQIAALLGHEMTHVFHRHTLKQFRSTKNSAAFWGTIGLTIDVISGGLGSLLGQFSFLSSASGFSQALEFEADEGGFQMIQTKGYKTDESIKLFESLAKFTEDEEIKEPFFFSSHPRLLERIEKFKELNQSQPQDSREKILNVDRYQQITRQLRLDNIDLCFKRGYFKTAQRNIESFTALYPDDFQGWYRQAELYRLRQDVRKKEKSRDKADDYQQALTFYDKTIMLNPNNAGAWLGKARVLQKTKQTAPAKVMFKKYLELEPNSKERSYIEQFMNSPISENAK